MAAEPILTLPNSITVRAWRSSDEETIAALGNNPKIAQNLTDRFPSPYTREDAKWWINHCNDPANFLSLALPASTSKDDAPKSEIVATNYAICFNDHPIGSVGLEYEPKCPRAITMGYWVAEEYWGKGIATIVATSFSDWVFDTFKWVVRIDGDAYSWNPASQKVLQKAGFVYEGTQRFKACKNGKFGDIVLFGKIRPGVSLEMFESSQA